MKFLCLGYMDESKWEAMSKSEQEALMQECFAYDDVLRKHGHFVAGEALQSARAAKTLRWTGGKAHVTDGPFAETKEQLGGLLVLEARDMNHALELMSKPPGSAWAARSRSGGPRRSLRCTPGSARPDNEGAPPSITPRATPR